MTAVGQSVPKKESWNKVTGAAEYTGDSFEPDTLSGWIVTSPWSHAAIRAVDVSEALRCAGVVTVITSEYAPLLVGPLLLDRPPLAMGKVRYFGEPVALVIAHSEPEAMNAAQLVKVYYDPLPAVHSVQQAMAPNAPLVHEYLGSYTCLKSTIYPQAGTNIAHLQQVRKGDMPRGWSQCTTTVETTVQLPHSDHAAMETRIAKAQIRPDGTVIIESSTQGPFTIKELLSHHFNIEEGKIIVITPLVGGGYGGKTPVQLEILAYLASKAVGGRPVRIANTREHDITSSPGHIGFEATVKLGADNTGKIFAAELVYRIDAGAYSDSAIDIAEAIAANGTGPYSVANLKSDTYCVYTNKVYCTAFRGFGHLSYTFAVERAIDKLAYSLGIDPFELRRINAIREGDTSPTQVKLTLSNLGDLPACLDRVKELIKWDEGQRINLGNGVIKAKGLSCFWKTSSSPSDAGSGAFITFNDDGTLNLNVGAVEIGPGTKTTLAQILAERLRMDVSRIYVDMPVNTRLSPKHWKTVASMSTFMVGNAVLRAAEDVIEQLRNIGSIALRCPPNDLDVARGRVFLRDDPSIYIDFRDIVHGYKYSNGNAVGNEILGRGSFVMRHITPLDRETGKGRSGPGWTVGSQAVEVELDTRTYSYRIRKAITVLDAGRVINPKNAIGVVKGAMSMGLSYGSREEVRFNESGVALNPQLRTYKLIRFGENPDYIVEFVETPWLESPYGARPMGEHGILGMPAALAGALSAAAGIEIRATPITPEMIWKMKREVSDDTV